MRTKIMFLIFILTLAFSASVYADDVINVNSINVYSADEEYIGIATSINNTIVKVVIPSINMGMLITTQKAESGYCDIDPFYGEHFTTTDCTGTSWVRYMGPMLSSFRTIHKSYQGTYLTHGKTVQHMTPKSTMYNNKCHEFHKEEYNSVTTNYIKLIPIEGEMPFNVPIKLPLIYEYEGEEEK